MTAEADIDFQTLSQIDLAEVDRLLAEASLYEFIRQGWSIIEPGTEFVDGPHIRAICLHLERLLQANLNPHKFAAKVRKLLINIPPRCAKSLIVSVFFPAWVWTRYPEKRFYFASYSEALALRDSLKCRRIIESPWYQANWGTRVRLAHDQNTKGRFDNDRAGFRIATSVGGAATGEGGDFVIVDDAHNVMDAFSDAALTRASNWFFEAWCSRLNDRRSGCMAVIGQRVSEKDVSKRIIAQGDWTTLILPMEYDPERHCKTDIWEDWRRTPGELLWPERIDAESLASLKKDLGSYAVSGQLQQIPTPRGGGMFQRQWFDTVKVAPAEGRTIRYWDRAGTQGGGDYTVGLKMRKSGGRFYVLDIVRFQGSPLDVETSITTTAKQDGMSVGVRIEQDPGQAGKMEAQYQVRRLAGYDVKAVVVSKNKETRAIGVAAQAEAKNVLLVTGPNDDAPWVGPFLDEIATFPMGQHDDQVDALSGAFNELAAAQKIFLA